MYTDFEDYAPTATIADAAAQYHAQGLPCPWDCARCQPPEPDQYGEMVFSLTCGHETLSGLYDEEGDGRHNNKEIYCWTCHEVRPVTKTVVLLRTPWVFPVERPTPASSWEDPSIPF